MARLRRALHGVASSYLLVAVSAVFSLLSVPIALHYLDKERFGLWALMSSIVGYLSLVDAGMTSSAARLMIDHKDDRNGGVYGGFLKVVVIVTTLQGVLVFLVGTALAGWFAQLLAIPVELHSEFTRLLTLQCFIVGVSFSMRLFGLILSGHQRMDLVNYAGMCGLLVNLTALWFFFHMGFGVFSLSWAAGCAGVMSLSFMAIACGVLKFFPERGSWGSVSWGRFREIFDFGKDLFLVGIGTQLTMASQTAIVTRVLGLEAAAAWSVGMRVFNLLSQVIWRISDVAGLAFAEMMVRGETTRLRERYQAMVALTAALSGFLAVCFALCNTLFIPLWTHGKIQWSMLDSILLAVWLILMSISRSYGCFVLLTKKVHFMRYVYFMEGAVFVVCALMTSHWGGLSAIIACSIVCTTAFSGAYNLRRVSEYFDLPIKEIAGCWLQPMVRILLFLVPFAVLLWLASASIPSLPRLLINGLGSLIVGGFLFLRFGLPPFFKSQVLSRLPKFCSPIVKRVFFATPL